MVNENIATAENEAETTPTTEATSPDAESELSVPDELAREEPFAEEGPEPAEEGAEEAESEAAAEKPDEPEEEETPSDRLTREEHEAELSKVRSGLDRRIAELEKQSTERLTQAEQRAQQAEQQLQAQQLDLQVARWQQQKAQQYAQQGLSDEEAQRMAGIEASYAKTAYEHEVRAQRAEAEAQRLRGESTSLASRQSAIEMAQKYGVDDDHMPLLAKQQTLDDMESLAKTLGALNRQTKELSEAKLAEVPAGGEANKLDSGGGAPGGLTDEQKLADINTPLREVEEILSRRGEHPLR